MSNTTSSLKIVLDGNVPWMCLSCFGSWWWLGGGGGLLGVLGVLGVLGIWVFWVFGCFGCFGCLGVLCVPGPPFHMFYNGK